MKRVKLPVGNTDFEEIRSNNCFYIDKTRLIETLIENDGTKVFLFTRPRRFGKTLNMSMLSSFFDISRDSKKLFEGLAVSENEALCEEWMNRYPTILVSFKEVDGQLFSSGLGRIISIIKRLFMKYVFLLISDKVDDVDKAAFSRIRNEIKPSIDDIKDSLNLLVRMLHAHYGKKVILLIDEYDVPIDKANINGYYKDMIEVMRSMLQVLKDNDMLQFAVITGCLRIAKESIFTGLNNLYTNTILSPSAFEECFGFTEKEVTDTFSYLEIPEKLNIVKEWYDGYHFGRYDIYCPWDVINYLNGLNLDETSEPKNYWANTSGNQIVEKFVKIGSSDMMDDLDCLLAGDYIIKRINENITYDTLYNSEDNIWNILLMTGYLTPLRKDEIEDTLFEGEYALRVPNREIKSLFSDAMRNWIYEESRKENLNSMKEAIWKGDADTLGKEITKVLNKTLSYNDLYHEHVYHLFLSGLFLGIGYRVDSNKEYGMGRPDLVVLDKPRKRAVVLELKAAGKTVDDAISQIDEKKYVDGLGSYDLILSYGIKFEGKSAEVKLKDKIER